MANTVRQYVGARYVPKFADPVAWASGTSYEAMTIVTYNNASYTSKIPVPATVGNPADNPTYWVLTGNYNAQVEAYREEAVAVQENLTEEVSNREEADTNLQTQIDELKHKNAIVIGDSYGTEWEPDGTTSTAWQDVVNTLMSFDTYYKIGVSGIGFATSNTFLSQLQALAETLTDEIKNNIDTIVVGGGANDFGLTVDNIATGITNFCNYCKNTFPNAIVYIAYLGGAVPSLVTDTSWTSRATRTNIRATMIYYRTACFNNGAVFVQGFYWAALSNFSSDYVHPNANGKIAIAREIVQVLKGGNAFIIGETASSDTNSVSLFIDVNGAHLNVTATAGTWGSPSAHPTIIINSGLINYFAPSTVGYSSALLAVGSTYYYGIAQIEFINNNLNISFPVLNSSSTGWSSLSGSISSISLYIPWPKL